MAKFLSSTANKDVLREHMERLIKKVVPEGSIIDAPALAQHQLIQVQGDAYYHEGPNTVAVKVDAAHRSGFAKLCGLINQSAEFNSSKRVFLLPGRQTLHVRFETSNDAMLFKLAHGGV